MPVAQLPQILMLPIADLVVPDWNPRKVIFEEPLKTLMAYIQAGGKVPRILVWKGNGQAPWAVISGQRRREAFKRLGHTQVEVEVMDIPLEQAKVLAMGSNEGEPVFWLDWDIWVEKLYNEGNQGDQKLSQADLAARFGVTQQKVSYAIKVAGALTPVARDQIYNRVVKLGDPQAVTEKPILALAALGSPEEVEKALPRVLEERMTEGQVRQMVATLKNGGVAQVTAKAKPQPTPTAIPAPEPKATQASGDGLKELAMSGAAGALGGFLAANLKRALGTLVRRYMLHALAALGVLAFLGFHGVGNLFKPQTYTAVPETTKPSPLVPGDSKGTQGQLPVSGARETGRVRGDSVSVPVQAPAKVRVSKPSPKAPAAKVSTGLPAWTPEGIPLVKDFASRFYNRSYPSWEGDQDYLKARMTTDYGPVFLKQYYPPTQRVELRDKQEVQAFSNAQAPVVVGGAGNSAQYRVQGQLTLQNRSGKLFKNVWTKPVALEISVRHEEGIGNWVEKVTEVTPVPVQKAENGADPLKAVQDAAGAVSNVADGVAKVDGVKKILGL